MNQHALALSLAQFLISRHLMLSTSESCTGGMVASTLTDLAGSSAWFDRGFITYSNASKFDQLGVPMTLIQTCGAVSLDVAEAMAIGTLKHSAAQVALSITGVAGPTGGSSDKPVGLVCFGWAWIKDGVTHSQSEGVALLGSDPVINETTRHTVRTLARDHALSRLLSLLTKNF